jgi:hypothetical protein
MDREEFVSCSADSVHAKRGWNPNNPAVLNVLFIVFRENTSARSAYCVSRDEDVAFNGSSVQPHLKSRSVPAFDRRVVPVIYGLVVFDTAALQWMLLVLTGWLERREKDVVAYLIAENRLLRRVMFLISDGPDRRSTLPFSCPLSAPTGGKRPQSPTQGEGNNRPMFFRQNARSGNLAQRDAKGS